MIYIRIVSGRVGEGVRADAVPRHLHEGGARPEDQAQRGQDSGETSSIGGILRFIKEIRIGGISDRSLIDFDGGGGDDDLAEIESNHLTRRSAKLDSGAIGLQCATYGFKPRNLSLNFPTIRHAPFGRINGSIGSAATAAISELGN